MPRKPTCKMDECTRHTFASHDVCLPHYRSLLITFDAEPEPAAERPTAAAAAPELAPVDVDALVQRPPRPTITSSKQVWVDWVVAVHGASRDTAESATKRQLIDLDRDPLGTAVES